MSKLTSEIYERLEELNPNAKVLTGYDDALIGLTENDESEQVAVYDYNLLINIMVNEEGMTLEEATEWYDCNIEKSLSYQGVNCPVIIDCWRDFTPEREEI